MHLNLKNWFVFIAEYFESSDKELRRQTVMHLMLR